MKRILAAIDFSEASPRVVGTAAELAEKFDADLWLVHVAAGEPEFVGYDVGPESVREKRARELRAEHRELQQFASDLRDRGLRAHALLVEGPTVDTLLAEARRRDAELVVIGSHGRGMLLRAVLGSVSEGLVRRAPCPVLVIPARGDAAAE